tara:strand:+ start:136 stop:327 length:192 start_codon:yes stop_codon:yes gene_type:complete
MGQTLTDNDIKELAKLGDRIKKGLECDINDMGIPCRSDRLDVVETMIKYLEIHDFMIWESDNE